MIAAASNSLSAFNAFLAPPDRVAEAWGDLIDVRGQLSADEWNFGLAGSGGSSAGYGGHIDRRDDRARGEDFPRFRTEQDLAAMRGLGRFFGQQTAFGVGALNRLGNYTFDSGFVFKAQAAEGVGDVGEDLLKAVQRVVDACVDRNNFSGGFDREIDRRARRDGQATICLELVDSWQADFRFAEPSQLTEPANPRPLEDWLTDQGIACCDSFASSWSFGVHTVDGRHDRALGYHFVWNTSGTSWDYYPDARVSHIKRNVDANVKCGVPDFNAIPGFIASTEKLLRNTEAGASVQAAIPFVKEYLSRVTKDQATAVKAATTTTRTAATPLGAREMAQQYFGPATIPIARDWEFKDGPGGDSRAQGFIAVIQAAFRYMGTLWDMPEAMISGDASNANLASALVAGDPFVKAREADQLVYSGEFRKLIWKAIKLAYDAGFFDRFNLKFSELQAAIYLKIDPPSVAVRDKLKDVQTDAILVDKGAMAVSTMATNAGLDHKAEIAEGAKPMAVASPYASLSPTMPTTPDGNPLSPQAPAQPAAPGTLEPTAALKLNGAQITSAAEILSGVRSGNVAAFAAEELLVGVGIDRQAAKAMIAATVKLPDPTPAQPIAGPIAPTTATNQTAAPVKESHDHNGPRRSPFAGYPWKS